MRLLKVGSLLAAAPVVGYAFAAVLFLGYIAWLNEQAETGWDREHE